MLVVVVREKCMTNMQLAVVLILFIVLITSCLKFILPGVPEGRKRTKTDNLFFPERFARSGFHLVPPQPPPVETQLQPPPKSNSPTFLRTRDVDRQPYEDEETTYEENSDNQRPTFTNYMRGNPELAYVIPLIMFIGFGSFLIPLAMTAFYTTIVNNANADIGGIASVGDIDNCIDSCRRRKFVPLIIPNRLPRASQVSKIWKTLETAINKFSQFIPEEEDDLEGVDVKSDKNKKANEGKASGKKL